MEIVTISVQMKVKLLREKKMISVIKNVIILKCGYCYSYVMEFFTI